MDIHIRFVLDDVKYNGIENQNNHWQPLHKMCPFCLLDFRYVVELLMHHTRNCCIVFFVACSIYSLIEENDEDSLYFFTKSGLGSKVDFLNTNVSNRNTHIPSFGEDHSPERYLFDAKHYIKVLVLS